MGELYWRGTILISPIPPYLTPPHRRHTVAPPPGRREAASVGGGPTRVQKMEKNEKFELCFDVLGTILGTFGTISGSFWGDFGHFWGGF